jgi:hypothetical protein
MGRQTDGQKVEWMETQLIDGQMGKHTDGQIDKWADR